MGELKETFHCILVEESNDRLVYGAMQEGWLTSLLQVAQSSAECMIALRMAHAAGERLRSGEGIVSRCSGGPRA